MGIDAGTSGRRSGAESKWRIDFLSVGIMGCVCSGVFDLGIGSIVVLLFRCSGSIVSVFL